MPSLRENHPFHLRRSVLCVPAANPRALEKALTLECDVIIYDLEDSVFPEQKPNAREALAAHLATRPSSPAETIIRINGLDTDYGQADLETVLACNADALLIPKVESPRDIQNAADWLFENDAPESLRLWAMIETPRGVLNAAAIAEAGRTRGGRLDCFVAGLNDLRSETGTADLPGRDYCIPWLMQILLAARACGLDAIDAVYNHIRNAEGFESDCRQGSSMGFDGKMLIHPDQIGPANAAFGVTADALAEADAIIAAFAEPGNDQKGVINLSGRMVERLHLAQALRLRARADAIAQRKTKP